MVDYVIFGFGLFVTLVVGFGLTTMITVHNRAIESNLSKSSTNKESTQANSSDSEPI